MRCVSPRKFFYRDLVTGRDIPFDCPCGKCIACLHNKQKEWEIRVLETSKAYDFLVYDTLTFAPKNLPLLDVSDLVYKEIDYAPKTLKSIILRYSNIDTATGEVFYRVPCVSREIIYKWIKQGRELFTYHYGYRPKWKYLIVEEYGPRTSRPHFHLLMWGIEKQDYIRFLGNKWKKQFGHHKVKYIGRGEGYDGGSRKDLNCVSRYLSKYVSKGVFESPLVTSGLSPKPFRVISNGIGEEYLNRDFFKYFSTPMAALWRSFSVVKGLRSGDPLRCISLKEKINRLHFDEEVKLPSDYCLSRLSTYYDDNGRACALPRYYRAKLLNLFVPNVLSYTIQAALRERADLRKRTEMFEFARSKGYMPSFDLPNFGYDSALWDYICRSFEYEQRLSASAAAKNRYTMLKNHYGRAMNMNFVC